jgi:hypothetical protein
MNGWNYLKKLSNKKYNYYPICPYCGHRLNILTKSFRVEFKTPKNPPIGANDLNLFNIIHKTYLKIFAVCENCEAKYDYDIFAKNSPLKPLTNIPSSKTLIKNIFNNELPRYPLDKTCNLILTKTSYKKILKKRPNFIAHISFHRLINSSLLKLYYAFQSLTAIFQFNRGFGSESNTVQVYSLKNSQMRKPTSAELSNFFSGDS